MDVLFMMRGIKPADHQTQPKITHAQQRNERQSHLAQRSNARERTELQIGCGIHEQHTQDA